MLHPNQSCQKGFTLIELLVVVIIIGILAAIAIPRFLDQRARANDTAAVSDLRNLIAVETGLEAESGLTDNWDDVDEEWERSSEQIRVCAALNATEDDITLWAWHVNGDFQYSYTRSVGVIEANDINLTDTCEDQAPGSEPMWPQTP